MTSRDHRHHSWQGSGLKGILDSPDSSLLQTALDNWKATWKHNKSDDELKAHEQVQHAPVNIKQFTGNQQV